MGTLRLQWLVPLLVCVAHATIVLSFPQEQSMQMQAYTECTRQINAPRVALLFLVVKDMVHRELWRQWLQSAAGILPTGALLHAAQARRSGTEHALGHLLHICSNATASNTLVTHRQFLFSVVMHAPPRHDIDRSTLLGDELLPDEQRVDTNWGGTDLVDATRRMLQHALEEPLNTFFVLLSDSTIPLYPPLVVYQQLLHRTTSAVNACPWPTGEAPDIQRYVEQFQDMGMLTRSQWRKSCQFFGLLRTHAEVVASSNKLWSAYQTKCPGSTSCVADEHYVPLVLSMHNLEHETDCHGHLTFTNWTGDTSPLGFASEHTTAQTLASLRAGQGDAPAHCHVYASQPPPVDLGAFVFLSQATPREIADAAGSSSHGDGDLVAAPSHPMHAHCPMFARKFSEAVHDRLLRVLQQHPLDVLPEVTLPFRRYNANSKRGRAGGAGSKGTGR